ncbi:hypothetical protein [Skermanella stibiiresistens]|uniref:hypothetical protein n=1 Tax=Skermanella stibiiresistens TaxID=913326 RepID=UPI0004BA84B8|nr:hypothetical protein [Skermanella stibiiresistens]
MIKGRVFHYEIMVSKEGRWTIDSVVKETDAGNGEQEAVDEARLLLAGGDCDEVRIIRVRTMPTGYSTKAEILHEVKPPVKAAPVTIKGKVDRVGPCETVADVYGLESRMILARLFRMFLDKHQITTTEMLHNWIYLRKLQDTGNLVNTATHQIAMAQAKELGIPAKDRIRALEKLIHTGMSRARDIVAEKRKLPRFDPQNMEYLSRRITAREGDDSHDFVFTVLVCDHLLGSPSVGGKLEAVLGLMTEGLDPRLGRLLEGVAADALGNADIVKELLGPQHHLAASLCRLADFLHGRLDLDVKGTNPMLARLGGLIKRGQAPSCRAVLLERLLSELKRDHPLDHKEPDAEGGLLERVVTHLRRDGSDEMLGGPLAEQAVSARLLRHRQGVMRKSGMLEAADALARTWKPDIKLIGRGSRDS